ncbi:Glutathione S-transferase S1 [Podila epicladia]|nr:Glutathione S-transferase S1 [Podila epicladia]
MTSNQTTKSTFTTRTNPALVAAAAATTSGIKYRILYLKLHGMAATTRAMLAISGEEWESVYPTDWATEKKKVPMGVMPVLYEVHQASGLTLEIPESEAIERYLARKYSLLGQDLWEETAINVFYSSSNAVMANYVNKVLLAFPDTKARELEKFVAKEVPSWIEQHEKWLERNGLNGHYVGGQLSIADIRSVICLDRYMTLPECKDQFSETKTPGLFKLKSTLEQNERYWAWIHSVEFEAINVSTQQRLAVLSG